MAYPEPLVLSPGARLAFCAAVRAAGGTERAAKEWAAEGFAVSKNKITDLKYGRSVSSRADYQRRIEDLFDHLGIDCEHLFEDPPRSLAAQVRGLLGDTAIKSNPPGRWAALMREPRVFYDLICDAEPQLAALVSQTNDNAIGERFALANACDAVQAIAYRNPDAFTEAEVTHAHNVGLSLVSSLSLEGSPDASCWCAKLIHNRQHFGHRFLPYSVLDSETLDTGIVETFVHQMDRAERVAREPAKCGVELPAENLQVAAEQAGCKVRSLGHAGDLSAMRRAYDEAKAQYPREVRLDYWRGVWEYIRGERRRAHLYLRKAAEMRLACGSITAGECQRLARAVIALVLEGNSEADEVQEIIDNDSFWVKLRCALPRAFAKPFDSLRRQRGLAPIVSLRVA